MTEGPLMIERANVSLAWASAFDKITRREADEIAPLVVSITGFEDNYVQEDQAIRDLVDAALSSHGLQSVRTVANTIFPSSLWNPQLPPSVLFKRYSKISKKLRKYAPNRNGLYFERMIDFHPSGAPKGVNQLQYILETRAAGNPRRSAYQVSLLDPTHDDTNQHRRGFPCLQQVSVVPLKPHDSGELALTGYYASQTMFERAYGNYIGLCDLGRFFAWYWNMRLTRVTCIASIAQLDTANITKTEARTLAAAAKALIAASPEHESSLVEG